MMTKKDLSVFGSQIGFNLWQTEKDYLQHLFLMLLSMDTKDGIVFKGGTAMQKVYGLNRFSIDLDFTSVKKGFVDTTISKIKSNITKFGYPSEFKKISGKESETFLFKIEGPLYDGTDKTISTLYIELSFRESVMLKPLIKEIVPVYTDIQPYISIVMQPQEIMAEKIRAIFTRNKSRDVYDFWFLVKKGVIFDPKIVDKKLKYYKIIFDSSDFIKAINNKKSVWEAEMKTLMKAVPDFNSVIVDIQAHLNNLKFS